MKSTDERTSGPSIPPMAEGYPTARTLAVISSGLLLFGLFADLDFAARIPLLEIEIDGSGEADFVVFLICIYAGARTILEWSQTSSIRRSLIAARLDFSFTLFLVLTAVVLWGLSSIDLRFLSLHSALLLLGSGLWGFITGTWTGSAAGSISLIRSREEARTLGLPRVPVVTASLFRVLGAWILLTLVGLVATYFFFEDVFVTWIGTFAIAFLIAIMPYLFEYARPKRRLPDGSVVSRGMRAKEMREIVDLHDSMYCLSGGMPASHGGSDPIYAAAERGDRLEVQRLLDAGHDPDRRGYFGWTPLMIAAANGHFPVVQKLLSSGADPNQFNTLGRNAIMFASRYGDAATVGELLKFNADPNLKKFGHEETALATASKCGHRDVVAALLKGGANAFEVDKRGLTALDMAHRAGHGETATLLRKAMRANAGRQLGPTTDQTIAGPPP